MRGPAPELGTIPTFYKDEENGDDEVMRSLSMFDLAVDPDRSLSPDQSHP